jgi:hypothetical protein
MPIKNIKNKEHGFASIQFVFLMAFSIILLSGFLNIMFIEYQRNTAITSLRDAARSGTRYVDLQSAVANTDKTDLNLALTECKKRGEQSLKDLSNEQKLTVVCEVTFNDDSGSANGIKASLSGTPDAVIVPWALPYENIRLKNLSQSFIQREVAK